jgi:hypothetical protein
VRWAPFIVKFIDEYTRGTDQAAKAPKALAQLYTMVIVVARQALGIESTISYFTVRNPPTKYEYMSFQEPQVHGCPATEFVSSMSSVMDPSGANDGRFVLLGMLIDDALTKIGAELAEWDQKFAPPPSRNIFRYFDKDKYPSFEAIKSLSDRFYWRQALVMVMQKFSRPDSQVPITCVMRGLIFLRNWWIVGEPPAPQTKAKFAPLVSRVEKILIDWKTRESELKAAVEELVYSAPFFAHY